METDDPERTCTANARPGGGDDHRSRRAFLRTAAAGGAAAAVAAEATGTAAAQESGGSGGGDFGGWLSDVGNYDGDVVDATGESQVTIDVGAQGNGGNFAFDPPAVKVDPGTTVVWEWTGQGGGHNVVGENREFTSGDIVAEAGHTYKKTFQEKGTVKYYCEPHRPLGMKGVVVVGQASEEAGGGGGGGEGGGEGGGQLVLTNYLLGFFAAVVLGVLSPIVFFVVMALRRDEVGAPRGDADDLQRVDTGDQD
ncbi:MAG: halocyanin domain-containing protein [Haloarculaceae archaeon]